MAVNQQIQFENIASTSVCANHFLWSLSYELYSFVQLFIDLFIKNYYSKISYNNLEKRRFLVSLICNAILLYLHLNCDDFVRKLSFNFSLGIKIIRSCSFHALKKCELVFLTKVLNVFNKINIKCRFYSHWANCIYLWFTSLFLNWAKFL